MYRHGQASVCKNTGEFDSEPSNHLIYLVLSLARRKL